MANEHASEELNKESQESKALLTAVDGLAETMPQLGQCSPRQGHGHPSSIYYSLIMLKKAM